MCVVGSVVEGDEELEEESERRVDDCEEDHESGGRAAIVGEGQRVAHQHRWRKLRSPIAQHIENGSKVSLHAKLASYSAVYAIEECGYAIEDCTMIWVVRHPDESYSCEEYSRISDEVL